MVRFASYSNALAAKYNLERVAQARQQMQHRIRECNRPRKLDIEEIEHRIATDAELYGNDASELSAVVNG